MGNVETVKLSPEQVAMAAMQSEAMLWLMAGSNHVDIQIAILRKYWEAYNAAGGRTWGK